MSPGVLELLAPLGYRFCHGTKYLGVQKWDPHFGKYTCIRVYVRSPVLSMTESNHVLPKSLAPTPRVFPDL